MNEWDIVSVFVVIVGLFLSIGAPIIKLNTNITKLNENLKATQNDQIKYENDNHNAHKRLWDHNEKQDAELEEHRLRLHDLDGK